MTCREKLKLEHPECIGIIFDGGCQHCPHTYGYLPDPGTDFCAHTECYDCWDREIPETPEEAVNRVQEAFSDAMGLPPYNSEPHIKDSGDRTEFATGAVRDMREGKGRCDLMPLAIVANLISGRSIETENTKGIVIHNIRAFLEKNDTYYLYLALEHFCDRCYERSVPTMFLEVAKHFEEGAKKYGESNWQLGIPPKCYIDSAVRHYLKWCRGDQDEHHERAFVWNLMCCIWEVDYHKEENDEAV